MDSNSEIPPELRWACRRGMLELDVILGRFLENQYLLLDRKDQFLFEKLLKCEDQDLYQWLTMGGEPADSELSAIVDKVCSYVRSLRSD